MSGVLYASSKSSEEATGRIWRSAAEEDSSRDLLLADEESLRIAAATAAALVCMVPFSVTGSLAANAADGTPWPTGGALMPLLGVVALSVIGWSAARWWFGPSQVRDEH